MNTTRKRGGQMIKKDSQVDMHLHTTASDGTWTVEELVAKIVENKIKVFSITDHDIIHDHEKIIDSMPNDVYYTIGSEISCMYNGEEYHILAYGFDYKDARLNELVEFNQIERDIFNTKTVEYAKKINKIEDIADYESYEYNRKKGGWKSFNYILDKNVVKDLGEYFEIIKLKNETMNFKDPVEVIKTIKDAGGYAFLAHPSAYTKGERLSLEVLKEWKDYGISGIECFSPYLKDIEDADYYIKFCEENDLMISAGSDCHGEFNKRTLGIPKVSMDKVRLGFIKDM